MDCKWFWDESRRKIMSRDTVFKKPNSSDEKREKEETIDTLEEQNVNVEIEEEGKEITNM